MSEDDNIEVHYLERETAEYFGLIRKLWINAANPVELAKIRENFGVENILNALNFKNPLGVKAALGVLLYLSVSDGYADFFTDTLIENLVDGALKKEENVGNFILIGRLVRILQTYKSFSDWILTRGHDEKENKLWERFTEFEDHQDEEVRKEMTRAVKEGMRINPLPDNWCTLPDHVVENLKTNVIWAITDIENETLDELSKGSIEGTRGDEEISRLEQINRQLRADGNRKIAALEAELEAQNDEKENLQNEIDQIYRNIQSLREGLGESLSNSLSLFEPLSEIGEDNVNGLRKTLHALGTDIGVLRKADPDLRKRVLEGSNDVRSIRQEDRVNDVESFRSEFTDTLHKNLQGLQKNLKVASVTNPTGTTSGSADDVLNSSLSLSSSGLGNTTISDSDRETSAYPAYYTFPKAPSELRGVRNPAWAPLANPSNEILPFGWVRKVDARTNHFYYINRATGEVQWNAPVE